MDLPSSPAELTPDWLAAALTGAEAFHGTTIRTVRPTEIGEGFGLDGIVARLDLETEGLGAPASIVVKFAKAERGLGEVRFYETIAPRMPIRLAGYFAGVVDEAADRAILLLEHVSPAEQGDVLRGANGTQALAVARTMARFHAEFWGADDPVLSGLTLWTARADSIAGRVGERLERFFGRHRSDLSEREGSLVESLPELLEHAESEMAEVPRTLIHGDLHLDNILFPSPDDPVILDWPDARRGPAAMDIVRLLVEGMTVEFRRRREGELLGAYAAARAAAGRPLPSPDQWRRQMNAAFVWHLAYAVAWAGAENPGYDIPRVRELVHSLVRNAAAAAADHVHDL